MKTALVFVMALGLILGKHRNQTEAPLRYKRQTSEANIFETVPKNMQELRNFCPNTKLSCADELKAESGTNGSESCCYDCDCTDDCYALGTCCFDKPEHESSANMGMYGYVTSAGEICSRQTLGPSLVNQIEIKSYLLVQTCPPFKDDERCSWPVSSDMSQMSPVFSTVTKMNYRNRFCAMCNNITGEIVPWSFQFNSAHFLVLFFFNILVRHVGAHNQNIINNVMVAKDIWLEWIPPPEALVSTRTCIDYSSSYCENPTLINLCNSGHMPIKGTFNIYRNIYCKACQEKIYDDNMEPITQCPAQHVPKLEEFVSRLNPAIFDPTISSNDKDDLTLPNNTGLEIGQCNEGEIYYKGQCAELSCPVIYVRDGTRCLNVFTHVRGIGLAYRLGIELPAYVSPGAYDFLEIGRTFVFSDTLRKGVCEERIESSKLTDSGSFRANLVFMVQLTELVSFSFQDIFAEFKRKIAAHRKRWNAGLETFSVEMETGHENFGQLTSDNIFFITQSPNKGTSGACTGDIPVTELQICTGLRFYNVTKVGAGRMGVGNIIFEPTDYVKLTQVKANGKWEYIGIHVCLDTFLRLYDTSVSLISSAPMSSRLAIIVVILLHIVIYFYR